MAETLGLERMALGPADAGPDESPGVDEPPAAWTLVDMPAAWIQQLLAALDPAARLQLFMGWRAMRDLMLSQRPVLLRFSLPITPERAQGAQASLELACTHSSSVQLVLKGARSVSLLRLGYGPVPLENTISARTLLTNTLAALGHPLTPITCVELTGLQLDALVPSWLTTTCPSMTRLTLDGCHWPDASASQPQCTQLSELVMSSLAPLEMPFLVQQLSSLTGLRSLTINRDMNAHFLSKCAAALGTQLTKLSFASDERGSLVSLQNLPAQFPRLSELCVCSIGHLSGMILNDAAVEALLSMPTLRVVGCRGFQLQQSYADRECRWTQISFEELDVASFDRLPLRSIQRFEAVSSAVTCVITPNGGVEAATRVAAVVAAAGGVEFGDHVCVDNVTAPLDTAPAAAIMPLLSTSKRITRVTLSHIDVTRGLLLDLSQNITSPALATVSFLRCNWHSDAWSVLLTSMPPTVTHVYVHCGGIPEMDLVKACVNATRPISLKVVSHSMVRPEVDVVQRIRQASWDDAGHQHVNLSII